MMKFSIYIFLLCFCFFSCKQKSNTISNKSEKCEVNKQHIFSDQNTKDTFKIKYNCENLEGPMIFQITNDTGKTIYEKEFLGTQFYDYGRPWYLYVTNPKRGEDFDYKKMNKNLTDSLHKADLKYIKSRIDNFFSPEKFIKNPLSNLEKDFISKENLKKIKNENIIVGFSYKLFEGGGFEIIGYSKKLDKILLIAECC